MNKIGCFKYIYFISAIPFALHLVLSASAWGVPCKGRTVDIGETMQEVSAKCGGAMVKEQWTVKVEETAADGTISSRVTTVDEWTYDSGPDDLLQTYRFEGGKVAGIANPGYGRARDALNDTCRNGASLTAGDTTVETYLKCGEPLAREKRADRISESESNGKKQRTSVSAVDWTYRYGPDLPGYTVTFENGVATNIRAREFGK